MRAPRGSCLILAAVLGTVASEGASFPLDELERRLESVRLGSDVEESRALARWIRKQGREGELPLDLRRAADDLSQASPSELDTVQARLQDQIEAMRQEIQSWNGLGTPPSPDALRRRGPLRPEVVREVLAAEEFDRDEVAGEGAWDRMRQWLGSLLQDALGWLEPLALPIRVLAGIIVFLFVGALVYTVWRRRPPSVPDLSPTPSLQVTPPAPQAGRLLERARAALAEGAYELAIRLAMQSLLQTLEDASISRHAPGRTNGEHRRRIAASEWGRRILVPFDEAVGHFERTAYGSQQPGPGSARSTLEAAARIAALFQSPEAST